MAEASHSDLAAKYDAAAPGWSDKMRLLGYRDAYLGFLASQTFRAPDGHRVIDIGCGSGAFAEAWASIHGPQQRITLLDPSAGMLTRAKAALGQRGIDPALHQGLLDSFRPGGPGFDCLLVAHVIEHVDDPVALLSDLRKHAAPGARLWLVVSKPHWCNAIIWFQWRHRAYAPTEVQNMLVQAGWQMEAEYAFPAGPPSRTSRGYLARA